MEQRVSIKLELVQKLLQLVSLGKFDLQFGEISGLMNEVNKDAKVIEELKPEPEVPAEPV